MLWLGNMASGSVAVLSSALPVRVQAWTRVTLLAASALFAGFRPVLSHGQAYMPCQLTDGFTALLVGGRDLCNFCDDCSCFHPLRFLSSHKRCLS